SHEHRAAGPRARPPALYRPAGAGTRPPRHARADARAGGDVEDGRGEVALTLSSTPRPTSNKIPAPAVPHQIQFRTACLRRWPPGIAKWKRGWTPGVFSPSSADFWPRLRWLR